MVALQVVYSLSSSVSTVLISSTLSVFTSVVTHMYIVVL